MNMASEYKNVALEILREYLESEEALIFEYSGNFEASAAELKEKAMGYLKRLGEDDKTLSKLAKGMLINDFFQEGEE